LEFLQDTEMDAFQSNCVKTMDSCAHTLLDTVAMVLDYNKVSTIQRKTSSISLASQDSNEQAVNLLSHGKAGNEPLFAASQECDVAQITEEVMYIAVHHLHVDKHGLTTM
jgi:hypothetical protein